MTVAWLAPIAAVMLGLVGPRFGRRLRPSTSVPLLTIAAVVTSIATGMVLGMVAFLTVARIPTVARMGGWSSHSLGASQPADAVLGVIAGVAVVALLSMSVTHAAVVGRDLLRSARLCRRVSAAEDLVVLDSPLADAFAMPGLPGRVVVSTAMLRALPPNERAVLLAHESAHLRFGHHAYVALADLAAAANPFLRPVARLVREGVERWADEVAATELGDRRLAAKALARAGLARSRTADGRSVIVRSALPGADGAVSARVSSLLAEPAPPRRTAGAALVIIAIVAMTAVVHTELRVEARFDLAESAFESTAVHGGNHVMTGESD